jgi:hypothetical protein
MHFDETTSDTGNNLLVPSFSIQNKSSDYFLFSEEPDYSELNELLFSLDIERKEMDVKDEYLLTLFQQEMSACSWAKWSSLDHALEKLLQWPLLSAQDVGTETKASAWKRVRPAERSILLKNNWGLIKAYGIQGFVRGLELGLFTSIHLFIYSMLLYRLVSLVQTGATSINEFRSSFIGSDQKGIDSLVRLLASLDAYWLRLILTSPLIIGGIQGFASVIGALRTSPVKLKSYMVDIYSHLQKNGSLLRDGIYEYLPGISSNSDLSISGKLQKLESLVRWDGRLSSEERRQIFDVLCAVAVKGKKNTQLNALQYLAKIAHGIGFKDLPRLKEVGYSKEELITILYTKGKALEVLTTLLQEDKESHRSPCQKIYSLPQRFYRQYLLWWLLGLKTHVLKQQLPALLLKTAKLVIELYFFQMIVLSILEAIRCPDKPGFELGFGYPEWATELTTDCFIELVENQFRTINLSDSVDDLVEQIPLFNLADLDTLALYYKNLTGSEMAKILTAVTIRGAPLTLLIIVDYFADTDMKDLTSNYLKTSKINTLELGCQADSFSGGEGLTSQGLQYLTDILPDMQLTFFKICFPNVDNKGIIALAEQLNKTKINRLNLVNANINDTAGQIVVQTLTEISTINRILLASSGLGDETVRALAPLVENNLALTSLGIEGDLITDQGAAYFAQIIQNRNLTYVSLKSSQITDSGMISLANSLKELPSLNYGLSIGSQAGEEGIITLSKQLNQTNFFTLELVGYGKTLTLNSMQALVSTLPTLPITQFLLNGYQLNNETTALLADGVKFSLIMNLSLVQVTFVGSGMPLGIGIIKLETLEIERCNFTNDDLIALAPYLPGSAIQALLLGNNSIGDPGVLALAKVLPFTNISILDLEDNKITDIGAQALADVYASTRLYSLMLYDNNISSNLLAKIEIFQWQQYCQDQLCHSNTQYNGYTTTVTSHNPPPIRRRLFHTTSYDFFDRNIQRDSPKKTIWNNGSLIEVIDNKTSHHQPNLLLGDFITSWNSLLPNFGSPIFTGTMILGVMGFGLLLYKNATIVRNIVNSGFRLLQNYLQMAGHHLKIAGNLYSFLASSKSTRTTQYTDSHQTVTANYY